MSSSSFTMSTFSPNTRLPNLLWKKREIPSKYAYVVSVFKDEKYLLGALVVAWSMKMAGSNADIILLATDVSEELIELAKCVFDRIYEVSYLRVSCHQLRTDKQRSRYSNWMDISCSKWNCLALVEYNKIIFLDSDLLILQSLDNLFKLSTPAGTFSSPQAKGYCENGGMYNPYLLLKEGDLVNEKMIAEGLDGTRGSSFTVIGTSLVLSPNIEHWNKFITMLDTYRSNNLFGYKNCNSGIDEQALVHFYSRHLSDEKIQWTHVSQRSGWIPWKPKWIMNNEYPPSVIHYFGKKPWLMERGEWIDLEPWYDAVKTMIDKWPKEDDKKKLQMFYGNAKLEKKNLSGCFYCKLFGINKKCSMFSQNGIIVCETYQTQAKKSSVE